MADQVNKLRAIRPNQGLRQRYQSQMIALIDEMHSSILYWLPAQYKEAPPAVAMDATPECWICDHGLTHVGSCCPRLRMAMDATPSLKMLARFRALAKKWQAKFDEAAPRIAEAYLKGSFAATDSAMRMALKDAGISIKFKMDRRTKDAFNASLAENVQLIKSIPQRYLGQVEGIVARSYAAGRDLESMVKDIKRLYPKAANSAELIARDQSNKANSTVQNTRRLQIGITQAIWMHSGGGKHPRKEHVKATGRVYNIREGCPIKNEKGQLEWIQPGQKIGCRCVDRSILPGVKNA